ncbi:unnamed protein product, partial [Prorocentrum cordatum]
RREGGEAAKAGEGRRRRGSRGARCSAGPRDPGSRDEVELSSSGHKVGLRTGTRDEDEGRGRGGGGGGGTGAADATQRDCLAAADWSQPAEGGTHSHPQRHQCTDEVRKQPTWVATPPLGRPRLLEPEAGGEEARARTGARAGSASSPRAARAASGSERSPPQPIKKRARRPGCRARPGRREPRPEAVAQGAPWERAFAMHGCDGQAGGQDNHTSRKAEGNRS